MSGPDTLAALEGQAAALEASAAPAAGDPGALAAGVADTAGELLSALQLARMMAAPMFVWWEPFGTVWSDQQLQQIATSGGAIMDRHGWNVGELASQWGPYIALIGATLPPAMATYQAIEMRKAQIAAADHEQRRAGGVSHQQAPD